MAETTAKKTAAAKPAKDPEKDQAQWNAQDVWERLAAPFPQESLERLPRALRARDDDKGRCEDTASGRRWSADGHYCNGWHARSVHLDYVGHAGITMRLNDVLGPAGWDFTPYAETEYNLPAMGRGEFFARLTVRVGDETVTKWDLAANYQSLQEAYGDALRRCAMRFGVGTYLWSKSEAALALKIATDEAPPPADPPAQQTPPPEASQAPPEFTSGQAEVNRRVNLLDNATADQVRAWWSQHGLPRIDALTDQQCRAVIDYLNSLEPGDPS